MSKKLYTHLLYWQLDDDNLEYSYDLELKVKQQVLFSLIKRVTK